MTDARHVLTRSAHAIAGWPQLWSRLLDAHLPGPDGRCAGCRSAVRSAPRWPCRIHLLAVAARAAHDDGRNVPQAARIGPGRDASGPARSRT